MSVGRPLTALRALTPWGWLATGVAVLVAGTLVLGGFGFRWDPLDLSRRRLEAAHARAEVAQAEAAARSAETRAQSDLAARVEAAHDHVRRLERAADPLTLSARTAADADDPLSPDRAARLVEHDRRLCALAPDLGGCAAAPGPAGPGEPAV